MDSIKETNFIGLAGAAFKTSCVACICFGIILDIIGLCMMEEEFRYDDNNSEIIELYSLKDNLSIDGSINSFLTISGSITTKLKIYYVEKGEDGSYRIKSVEAESNNVSIEETNDQKPSLKIDNCTNYFRLGTPLKSFSIFTNIFDLDEYTRYGDIDNYRMYTFIVPEGTISYDYNIDLE